MEREGHVFEFVLINHAHVVESVGDDDVRRLYVFGREGDLLQVILTRLGVGRDGVWELGFGGVGCDRVALVIEALVPGGVGAPDVSEWHGLVAPAPIVLVDAFAPAILELRLALGYGLRVVEVELATGSPEGGHLRCVHLQPRPLLHEVAAAPLLLGQIAFLFGFLGFAFLFLLHLGDDLVDHGEALLFGHASQGLKAILQMYGLDVHHEFVKHGRETRDALVLSVFLRHG